jgi:hypoxanthine phosphoribosyltransferase
MSKIYYNDRQIRTAVHKIIRDMSHDSWRPDYIVGLTRGGLTPAVMISHYLNVPMHTLDVSFRDNSTGPESNLWMAEDAFGYVPDNDRGESGTQTDPAYRKNILIVDDINDSGRTLDWIKDDWTSSCLPKHPAWDAIWHRNVRFATIVDNQSSNFKGVDYTGISINKLETPIWVVFPWEAWWEQ